MVGEAFTDDALNGLSGTFHVANAQRDPFIVSEIELAQIPLQVVAPRRGDTRH